MTRHSRRSPSSWIPSPPRSASRWRTRSCTSSFERGSKSSADHARGSSSPRRANANVWSATSTMEPSRRLVALSLDLGLLEEQLDGDRSAMEQIHKRETRGSRVSRRAARDRSRNPPGRGHGSRPRRSARAARGSRRGSRPTQGRGSRTRSPRRSRWRRTTSSRKPSRTSSNTRRHPQATVDVSRSTGLPPRRGRRRRNRRSGHGARLRPPRSRRSRRGSRRPTSRVEPSRRRDAGTGGDPMRVAIAEDSVLLREGLARLLEEADFDVVARCEDADDLLVEGPQLLARRGDRRHPAAADAQRRGSPGSARNPQEPPLDGRARPLPVRRGRPCAHPARRIGRRSRLPAEGPNRRREGVRCRGPPGRGGGLRTRSDHRLHPAGPATDGRPDLPADAERARGARADGHGKLQPGHRRRARDHASRGREVRLQHLRQARPAFDAAASRAGSSQCCSTCAPEDTRKPAVERQVSRLPHTIRGCEAGLHPNARETP